MPLGYQLVDSVLGRLEEVISRVLGYIGAILLYCLYKIVFYEEQGNLDSLPPVYCRQAVYQPVDGRLAGKGILERLAAYITLRGYFNAGKAVLIVAYRI